MLCKWLPEDEDNNLPSYATHTVGVGGMVLSHDKEHLLAIQENVQSFGVHWKMPGGLLDPYGEQVEQACQREVWEETGIKSKFEGVLGVRELKGFGKFMVPDLYFVCLLSLPENGSEEINIIHTSEIKEAKWVHLSELPDHKFSQIASIFVRRLYKRYTEGTHKEFVSDTLLPATYVSEFTKTAQLTHVNFTDK
mmetsp:Transcript_36486/g.56006  ORF Transcript_36486/g.56006 Transcript_36486/m.56006 type:complete len:194 (-) Transcript_36486:4-585(-)